MKYVLLLLLLMTQTAMSETIRLTPEVKVNDYSEVFMPYITWITENSDYKYNGEPMPKVAFVSKGILQTLVYGAENVAEAEARGVQFPTVVAAYDKGLMYLPRGTDITSFECSVTFSIFRPLRKSQSCTVLGHFEKELVIKGWEGRGEGGV